MDIKKENEGVSTEKVAEALSSAKEARDASNEVVKSNKEITNSLNSVSESLTKLTDLTVKSKEDEKKEDSLELKSLKSEVALINSKILATKSGQITGRNEKITEKSKKFLEEFAEKIINKSKNQYGSEGETKEKAAESVFDSCGVLEIKSLRSFDNTSAGANVPEKRIIGNLDINLQTVSPVTSLVTNIAAGAIVAGSLGYKTFDESAVDIYEAGEMVAKQETPNTKSGEVDIYVTQNAAKLRISDKTLHSSNSGEMSVNPLLREFMAIEKKYEKIIARKILNGDNALSILGIFHSAHLVGSKIKKIATETSEIVTLKDLSILGLNLKGAYLRNSAILIDRAVLYQVAQEEGDDGHLKIEQFDYSNGIAAMRTPEGIIPLIGVDSSYLAADIKDNDGFADYDSFTTPGTKITSGYTSVPTAPGATLNTGKAVAILADFSEFYSLARSSVVQTGVDNSFGNLLNDGYVWGGKIGYVGGKVTKQEAGVILYVKA
ncbi:MAG: HK97 family phage major capsid protein [Psychroserpens sp.]|jgi:HK97 family phage major capsid protein